MFKVSHLKPTSGTACQVNKEIIAAAAMTLVMEIFPPWCPASLVT